MKQRYIDAVTGRNLVKVRIMLADELLLDPRGNTFKEMLAYAKQNLPNLFEDNKEANQTFVFDYDDLGNISSKTIYNYTSNTCYSLK